METQLFRIARSFAACVFFSGIAVLSGLRSFELQLFSEEVQTQVVKVDSAIELRCTRGLAGLLCDAGITNKRKITTYKHQVKIEGKTVVLTNKKKFPIQSYIYVLYLQEKPEHSLIVNKTKYGHWFQPIFLLIAAFLSGLLLYKDIKHKKADH